MSYHATVLSVMIASPAERLDSVRLKAILHAMETWVLGTATQ